MPPGRQLPRPGPPTSKLALPFTTQPCGHRALYNSRPTAGVRTAYTGHAVNPAVSLPRLLASPESLYVAQPQGQAGWGPVPSTSVSTGVSPTKKGRMQHTQGTPLEHIQLQ